MKSIEYNGIERPEYTPDMISVTVVVYFKIAIFARLRKIFIRLSLHTVVI